MSDFFFVINLRSVDLLRRQVSRLDVGASQVYVSKPVKFAKISTDFVLGAQGVVLWAWQLKPAIVEFYQ